MRLLFFAIALVFMLRPSWAQIRLAPADSSNTALPWFVERPTDLILTASFGPLPTVLSGYKGMHDFLDDQGIEMRRLMSVYGFGLHWRYRRFMLGLNASSSDPSNSREMPANGQRVFLKQSYSSLDLSAGYMVYTDRFISIMPRVGVGLSEYSIQYTFENTVPFDFDEPGSYQSPGSPNLVHESGHVSFALEFMNGYGNKKRMNGIIGGSIGYRHGWGTRGWEARPGAVDNTLNDRLGEFFLTAVLGIAVAPRNSTSR
ncbi:MAG: hypothetical protein AAGA85_19205 [Bacteroidota bacterium]